jgi:hypothetical protein
LVTGVVATLGVATFVGITWYASRARARDDLRWRAALDCYAEQELAKRTSPRRPHPSTLRATDMNDISDIARDRKTRIEDFAAELTRAVYPFMLRRMPRNSWLNMELGLWSALAETVQKWVRQKPSDASADLLAAWREGFLVEVTESAFYIALKNGIKGSLLEVELGLYRAVRLVIKRHNRVS